MNPKQRFRLVLFMALGLTCIGRLSGQDKESLFNEAMGLYQAGAYGQALDTYQRILETGYESGPVYYNMGNCQYKLQNIGQAILYYERARRLMPGDDDLRANLALANLAVVDKITPQQTFILFRLVNGFVFLFPKPVLTWIVAMSYLAGMVCLIGWILSRKRMARRILSRLCFVLAGVFLVLGLSTIERLRQEAKHVEGIIVVEMVDVVSAPSEDEGMEVFTLHEGTKVRIDQTSGEWLEIVLADGKTGWVKEGVLEII
jgi:hypothetical protein